MRRRSATNCAPTSRSAWPASLRDFTKVVAIRNWATRKQALVAYDQLIADLPDGDPAFRQLKTQTMRYALECWLQDKNYVAAVDKSLAWSKSARAANCKIPIGWP